VTGPSWTEFIDACVFFTFSFIVVVGCHVDLFNLSVFSSNNGVRVNVFFSFGAEFVDNDVSFYVDFFFVPHCVLVALSDRNSEKIPNPSEIPTISIGTLFRSENCMGCLSISISGQILIA
jgi:hypothetical protein